MKKPHRPQGDREGTGRARIPFHIMAQPDGATCGPTCLHAVYGHWGDDLGLDQVVGEVSMLEEGGTLAVLLACHALRRGYRASIYTYDLKMFDPTWSALGPVELADKLKAQKEYKDDAKLVLATDAYLEFLALGGRVLFEDLTPALIRRYLNRDVPLVTGLSATYLYRTPREHGPRSDYDDVRGEPSGHFVVLCGYEPESRSVLVADPLLPNPVSAEPVYEVALSRLVCAILLGVLTYDAKILAIEPRKRGKGK